MTRSDAVIENPMEFAQVWAAAWNRRDVEAVLSYFHEEVEFASPVAKAIGFSADGSVRGKEALRRYWIAALRVNPDLHFEVLDVFSGVDSLVIVYRNQAGVRRAEVLMFDGELVTLGRGAFQAL